MSHITDGATAIGRAFGRERPGLIDVLHALADARTPAGACLAAAGLTEEAIVSWRRSAGGESPAPLLRVDRVAFTPDVDRLVASVRGRGPVLGMDRERARVGAELVTFCDAEEPELDALLDAFAVDRARLSAELDRSSGHGASFPFPRPYPGLDVYGHHTHPVFVLVPVGPGSNGFRRELPSLALLTGQDVPAAELGDQVLAGFRRSGRSEDGAAAPFWKELGYKSDTGFCRRARLVMATQFDFSVHFRPTRHVGPVRFDIMGTRTPVYAPIDDSAAIGDAVRAAVQGSEG
jgi:hypothetical protein